jgi:hypothetical protein
MTTRPSVALLGIVIDNIPDRAPAADIRPAEICGHGVGELGALDDGIINRFLRRARETLGSNPQEIEDRGLRPNRGLCGLGHCRLETLDLAEHGPTLAQLLGHNETEIGMGHNDRARKQVGVRNARKHNIRK